MADDQETVRLIAKPITIVVILLMMRRPLRESASCVITFEPNRIIYGPLWRRAIDLSWSLDPAYLTQFALIEYRKRQPPEGDPPRAHIVAYMGPTPVRIMFGVPVDDANTVIYVLNLARNQPLLATSNPFRDPSGDPIPTRRDEGRDLGL